MGYTTSKLIAEGKRRVIYTTVTRREAAQLLQVTVGQVAQVPAQGAAFANAANRWAVYEVEPNWHGEPANVAIHTDQDEAWSDYTTRGNQ